MDYIVIRATAAIIQSLSCLFANLINVSKKWEMFDRTFLESATQTPTQSTEARIQFPNMKCTHALRGEILVKMSQMPPPVKTSLCIWPKTSLTEWSISSTLSRIFPRSALLAGSTGFVCKFALRNARAAAAAWICPQSVPQLISKELDLPSCIAVRKLTDKINPDSSRLSSLQNIW